MATVIYVNNGMYELADTLDAAQVRQLLSSARRLAQRDTSNDDAQWLHLPLAAGGDISIWIGDPVRMVIEEGDDLVVDYKAPASVHSAAGRRIPTGPQRDPRA